MDLSLFYGKNYDSFLDERAEKLSTAFENAQGAKPKYIFSSSGRAEILGNHTDHNHGKVMVAAVSCDILSCVSPSNNDVVSIYSEGFPPIVTKIGDYSPNETEYGGSLALVKGIITRLRKDGYNFGGFTAHTTSNIFKGAGVSSSAAFEVLVCEIINKLYLGGVLTDVYKAVVSQYAENVFFGKPCGLLDQCGIAIGSLTKLDFNCPDKPLAIKLDAPLGYTPVIVNTGGNHAKLTVHYALIRSDMEDVAAFFGKKVLREVDKDIFFNSVSQLKTKFNSRAILRAIHFFNENDRVDAAADALKNGDSKKFLEQIAASGESSMCALQNCYVPGSDDQPVVLGIIYSRSIAKHSAFRVHGGGFAGSILGFVENGELNGYIEQMSEVFGKENVFAAKIRASGTAGIKL